MKKLLFIFVSLLICGYYACGQTVDTLVILHTDDVHSQVEPKKSDDKGGAKRRMGAIEQVRAKYDNVLLLDAGDFTQGSSYYCVFKGRTDVELMNRMGYAAATLGNHEFDNGCAALASRLKTADFPVVCANYKFANKKLAKVVKPYVIIERGGHRIGVFGLAVNLDGYVAPQIAREVTYLDPVACARQMVKELQNQNCDLIVCLSHLGVNTNMPDNDFEIARQVPEIDVIIGGHSHEEMPQPKVVGKTRICQMTNKGKCFGVLTIEDL